MDSDSLLYPGSRAEWILKRATDFDAKARNFRCVGCGQAAKWVCLDAACVSYNQSKALCLCDTCDAHFHMTSSPVMQNHRRLAPVLYISLLVLHRYQALSEVLPHAHGPVAIARKRPHSPGEEEDDGGDVTSSKRLSPPSAGSPTEEATAEDMKPLKIATTSSCSGGYPASEMPQYPPTEVGGSWGRNLKSNNSTSGIEYRATFGNNLRPIHARYARIMQHLRDDSTLALSEAFRRESFAKLTVKNYLGIAELKLVAAEEYEALLEAYKRRGRALITVSGLERECRRALSERSQLVTEMRKTGQLLPFFDIIYQPDMDYSV